MVNGQATAFELPCYGVQLYLQFSAPIRSSIVTGYALRGLLGRALFRQVCIYDSARCAVCALRTGCAYPQVFKPSEITHARLPGYVIHDWRVDESGYGLRFKLILLGTSAHYLETWLEALQAMNGSIQLDRAGDGRIIDIHDLGSNQRLTRLSSRKMITPISLVSEFSTRCRIVLETPLITKHDQHEIFFPALRTRLRRLCAEYGKGDIAVDHAPWTVIDQRLISRKLQLNNRAGKIKTYTGELVVDELSEIGAKILKVGALVHAGSDANCGMGRYRVESIR